MALFTQTVCLVLVRLACVSEGRRVRIVSGEQPCEEESTQHPSGAALLLSATDIPQAAFYGNPGNFSSFHHNALHRSSLGRARFRQPVGRYSRTDTTQEREANWQPRSRIGNYGRNSDSLRHSILASRQPHAISREGVTQMHMEEATAVAEAQKEARSMAEEAAADSLRPGWSVTQKMQKELRCRLFRRILQLKEIIVNMKATAEARVAKWRAATELRSRAQDQAHTGAVATFDAARYRTTRALMAEQTKAETVTTETAAGIPSSKERVTAMLAKKAALQARYAALQARLEEQTEADRRTAVIEKKPVEGRMTTENISEEVGVTTEATSKAVEKVKAQANIQTAASQAQRVDAKSVGETANVAADEARKAAAQRWLASRAKEKVKAQAKIQTAASQAQIVAAKKVDETTKTAADEAAAQRWLSSRAKEKVKAQAKIQTAASQAQIVAAKTVDETTNAAADEARQSAAWRWLWRVAQKGKVKVAKASRMVADKTTITKDSSAAQQANGAAENKASEEWWSASQTQKGAVALEGERINAGTRANSEVTELAEKRAAALRASQEARKAAAEWLQAVEETRLALAEEAQANREVERLAEVEEEARLAVVQDARARAVQKKAADPAACRLLVRRRTALWARAAQKIEPAAEERISAAAEEENIAIELQARRAASKPAEEWWGSISQNIKSLQARDYELQERFVTMQARLGAMEEIIAPESTSEEDVLTGEAIAQSLQAEDDDLQTRLVALQAKIDALQARALAVIAEETKLEEDGVATQAVERAKSHAKVKTAQEKAAEEATLVAAESIRAKVQAAEEFWERVAQKIKSAAEERKREVADEDNVTTELQAERVAAEDESWEKTRTAWLQQMEAPLPVEAKPDEEWWERASQSIKSLQARDDELQERFAALQARLGAVEERIAPESASEGEGVAGKAMAQAMEKVNVEENIGAASQWLQQKASFIIESIGEKKTQKAQESSEAAEAKAQEAQETDEDSRETSAKALEEWQRSEEWRSAVAFEKATLAARLATEAWQREVAEYQTALTVEGEEDEQLPAARETDQLVAAEKKADGVMQRNLEKAGALAKSKAAAEQANTSKNTV